jgi:hypothetical protein
VLLYMVAIKIGGEAIGGRPLLVLGVLLVVVGLQFFSLGLIAEMVTRQHEERTSVDDRRQQHVEEVLH